MFNFKTLFYNSRLQKSHKVILLGGELLRSIFDWGKTLKFRPWIKKSLPHWWRLWESSPRPPRHSMVVLTPRLAHRHNHSVSGNMFTNYDNKSTPCEMNYPLKINLHVDMVYPLWKIKSSLLLLLLIKTSRGGSEKCS